MKNKIYYACIVGVAIIIIGLVLSLVSCRSFKPVVIDGQCDECNDFYTVLAYYYASNNGDSAFVGTVYNECKNARAQIRKAEKEEQCRKKFFLDKQVNKNDLINYSQYLECVK